MNKLTTDRKRTVIYYGARSLEIRENTNLPVLAITVGLWGVYVPYAYKETLNWLGLRSLEERRNSQ